ncbi:MAG: hypothetical protein WC222_05015 [Parachlamydiales bacterium]|jgi:hypothetical protein
MNYNPNTNSQELLEADPLAADNPFENEIIEENEIIAEEERLPMEDESTQDIKNESSKLQEKTTLPSFGDDSVSSDQKISNALDFMEKALSQSGSPHFKEFWEARKVCLELFKDNIPPPARAYLWGKYCELSREARKLKEILDEQTAFAVEQIEIAVKALEDEIINEDEVLAKAPTVVFENAPRFFHDHIEKYSLIQKRLGILNAHASRINVLRKELIKTEMRIRLKNKFFQRLSAAGDKVFPVRKELIRQNSNTFIEDVNAFIATHFPNNTPDGDLYELREEIKALQNVAKQLTLNTHAFMHSRQTLSQSWDALKEVEKERKKVRTQQKVVYKQHQDELEALINTAATQLAANEITVDDARQQLENISNIMRKTELGRDEVKYLREALLKLREPIESKEKQIHHERNLEQQQRTAQRQEKIQALKNKLQEAVSTIDSLTVENASTSYQELNREADLLHLSRNEKSQIEKLFREFKEKISHKKDQAIFALAENEGGSEDLATIKADLKKLREYRQVIKENLDNLKKQSGGSGFDISKAIEINEQIVVEKERDEKAKTAIADLERKLRR